MSTPLSVNYWQQLYQQLYRTHIGRLARSRVSEEVSVEVPACYRVGSCCW